MLIGGQHLVYFVSCIAVFGSNKAIGLTSLIASCHCVQLKYCESLSDLIASTSNYTKINTIIKGSICQFNGKEVYVCCPKDQLHKRNARGKIKLNYLDEKTGRNCPPTFGDEYDYEEYLRKQEINVPCVEGGTCDGRSSQESNESPVLILLLLHLHSYHKKAVDTPQGHGDLPIPPKHKYVVTENECGLLPTARNENSLYPWIVRLAYLNITSRTVRYRCMGTIVSDEHVLTAAHCVENLVHDLRLIYVRVGNETSYTDVQIVEALIHPNYNEPLFNNDVALLKLSTPHDVNESFKKICLPQSDIQSLAGNIGLVVGWRDSNRNASGLTRTNMRYISLSIMNNTECAIRYAEYSENFEDSIVITPTEFCSQSRTMNDVCEGDSGGPFMSINSFNRCTLVGIVAFGPSTNCGQSNLPGVYMRISSYTEWIRSNIKISRSKS
uniref:CLIP domain-containing serine protease n=1 Tax=Glossina pallidipes TaxID=7398 RepID=A0A1A9ZT31_GLOPL